MWVWGRMGENKSVPREMTVVWGELKTVFHSLSLRFEKQHKLCSQTNLGSHPGLSRVLTYGRGQVT